MGHQNTPVAYGGSDERITVYFSLEEGWIHTLYYNWTADMELSSLPCKSSVQPYSEAQMRYLRARAETDRNIYIFQAKRDQP